MSDNPSYKAEKRKLADVFTSQSKKIFTGKDLYKGPYFVNCHMEEGKVYHFKFEVMQFKSDIYFGYCKYYDKVTVNDPYIRLLSDKSEVFDGINAPYNIKSIIGNVGVYEVICDMLNKRMTIRQGNGKEVEVCQIYPDIITLFAGICEGNVVKLIEYWKLPVIIERYKAEGDIELQHIDDVNKERVYLFNFQTRKKNLYYNESDNIYDRIKYIVCNKIFRGEDNYKYSFIINEEMKENEGIYHFYYEIMSVGTAGISFGYCQNGCIPNERLVELRVRGIYEVVYNMNMKIWSILANGSTILSLQAYPTSTNSLVLIKPCISIGDKNGSVKLIEYYKERENYGFNDITMYKNTIDFQNSIYGMYNELYTAEELGLPNSIYGMYNYEKYYWMHELSLTKANKPNTDITPIKEIIESRFILNDEQSKYINESDITDLIIFLNCYADENVNLEKPDSFITIVNNLKFVECNILNEDGSIKQDQTKKYLDLSLANVKVFQFPRNVIYIRDDYYTMLSDICKIIFSRKNFDIVITGQPGIGKTSFIYVLLFFIKNNLSYQFDEDIMKYLEKEELKREIENLKKQLPENKNQEQLIKEIKELEGNNIHNESLISKYINDVESNYKTLYTIFTDKRSENTLIGSYRKNNYCSYTITEFKENILVTNVDRKICVEHINNTIKRIQNYYKTYNFSTLIDINTFIKIEEKASFNQIVRGYILSLRIMNMIEDINQLTNSKEKNIKLLQKYEEMNRIWNILNEKEEKVKEIGLANNANYDDMIKKGLNYYFGKGKAMNIWNSNSEHFKDIYIIKGKRYGSPNERKIYLLKNGYIFKIETNTRNINNSIIIVDTFNGNFGKDNIIISVSSPESKNNDQYTNERKELYFDSLSNTEIEEWFENCIGFNRDTDFSNVCERYGNIPRQIYYHYLYKMNYENRDYWEYYKQLIESVAGASSYKDFVKKYMYRTKLLNDPLSNIILKYDLQPEWDNNLGHFILKPKDELVFISNSVHNYISCKFYPPKTPSEYKAVKDKYISFTDEYMKRMALKQITAYDLSTNEIKLKIRDEDSGEDVIASDPDFILDHKKEVSVYYPYDGWNFVYFILDENNYFDLIMDGVFIKTLLDNIIFDEKNIPEEEMQNSIREYSEIKSGDFMYCVIKNGNLIYGKRSFNVPDISDGLSKPLSKPLPATTIEDFDVYVKSNTQRFLERKCFKDMLKIIYPDDFNVNYPYQRNYLIFGHTKIGKTILAEIIVERIRHTIRIKNQNLRVDFICEGIKVPNEEDISKCNYPYIVVVDKGVIGEDDYPDAIMIIALDDPTKKNVKHFKVKDVHW